MPQNERQDSVARRFVYVVWWLLLNCLGSYFTFIPPTLEACQHTFSEYENFRSDFDATVSRQMQMNSTRVFYVCNRHFDYLDLAVVLSCSCAVTSTSIGRSGKTFLSWRSMMTTRRDLDFFCILIPDCAVLAFVCLTRHPIRIRNTSVRSRGCFENVFN